MKFGTVHGLSRPEVGSTKRIDVYGGKRIYGTSDEILYFWDQKTTFTTYYL